MVKGREETEAEGCRPTGRGEEDGICSVTLNNALDYGVNGLLSDRIIRLTD